MTALLELRGVRHRYPDVPAGPDVLAGLDLRVRAGSALAVLGANGAGKTTLLRVAAGSLRPAAGTVLLDGEPLRHTRGGLRRHRSAVQVVLQDPDDQLFSASVGQDVSFGPLNLGLPEPQVRARVAEALAALDLTAVAQRPTHLLSYGQRKRAALAGAVAMRPRLLVLDEPTAGLDPAGVRDLLAAVAGLRAGGTTVVLATHDLDLAYRECDEVAVLGGGRAVQGAPADLLGDERLVAGAGLEVPWALRVGRRLAELGLAPGPLPRDVDGVLALLAAASADGSGTAPGR